MSVLFLQGKLFPRTKHFLSLQEIFTLFQSKDLWEFHCKFKEFIEKSFSSREAKEKFFQEDLRGHLEIIRKEEEEREFFQFLFLPFDLCKFLMKLSGQETKSELGYFTQKELEEIVKNKFPERASPKIKEIFLRVKKEGEKPLQQSFIIAEKFLRKKCSFFVSLYFDLKNEKAENFERKLRNFFSTTIPLGSFYPAELAKFYLPYFFKKELFYFSHPFDFLFFYFQQRFILWKILFPEVV